MEEIRGYDEWKLQPEEHADDRRIVTECSYCLDNILEGTETYALDSEAGFFELCSLNCLVRFTSKFDADIDEFEDGIAGV